MHNRSWSRNVSITALSSSSFDALMAIAIQFRMLTTILYSLDSTEMATCRLIVVHYSMMGP